MSALWSYRGVSVATQWTFISVPSTAVSTCAIFSLSQLPVAGTLSFLPMVIDEFHGFIFHRANLSIRKKETAAIVTGCSLAAWHLMITVLALKMLVKRHYLESKRRAVALDFIRPVMQTSNLLQQVICDWKMRNNWNQLIHPTCLLFRLTLYSIP